MHDTRTQSRFSDRRKSRIGAAIAQQLIQDGYFVVGTATSESGAEKLSAAFGEMVQVKYLMYVMALQLML